MPVLEMRQKSPVLGEQEEFDEALADFSEAYADQNEKDHKALVQAVRKSRLDDYIES